MKKLQRQKQGMKEDIEDYELHDLLAEVVKRADKIGIHYNFNMEVQQSEKKK